MLDRISPREVAKGFSSATLDEIKRLLEQWLESEEIVNLIWGEKISSTQADELIGILDNVKERKWNSHTSLTSFLLIQREAIENILDR